MHQVDQKTRLQAKLLWDFPIQNERKIAIVSLKLLRISVILGQLHRLLP